MASGVRARSQLGKTVHLQGFAEICYSLAHTITEQIECANNYKSIRARTMYCVNWRQRLMLDDKYRYPKIILFHLPEK
jgi:hypothetical protein